jgi:hypothetical protein
VFAWKPLIDLLAHKRQLLRSVTEPFSDSALRDATFYQEAVEPFSKGHGCKY